MTSPCEYKRRASDRLRERVRKMWRRTYTEDGLMVVRRFRMKPWRMMPPGWWNPDLLEQQPLAHVAGSTRLGPAGDDERDEQRINLPHQPPHPRVIDIACAILKRRCGCYPEGLGKIAKDFDQDTDERNVKRIEAAWWSAGAAEWIWRERRYRLYEHWRPQRRPYKKRAYRRWRESGYRGDLEAVERQELIKIEYRAKRSLERLRRRIGAGLEAPIDYDPRNKRHLKRYIRPRRKG